jgi:hypothetical protein
MKPPNTIRLACITSEGAIDNIVVALPGWRPPATDKYLAQFTYQELDSEKHATVDIGWVYANGSFTPGNFPDRRAATFAAVDQVTQQRIAAGYMWRGARFSLSQNAQMKMTLFTYQVQHEQQVFPFLLMHADDQGAMEIEDAAAFSSLVSAFTQAVTSAIDFATNAKLALATATTVADLQRIAQQYNFSF